MPLSQINRWKEKVPHKSLSLLETWISNESVHVMVNRTRRTKLGDYRPARRGRVAIITVNEDLHPVGFLITLLHELAHHLVYKRFSYSGIKPHGAEWKNEFRRLLIFVIDGGILSDEQKQAVYKCYFKRESIAGTLCSDLQRLLNGDHGSEMTFVEDVPENTVFILKSGRKFRKGPKIRTRYLCTDVSDGKKYRVHPMAEIMDQD